MEQVSGGFRENNSKLGTAGMSIRCPACGASSAENFRGSVLQDPKTGSVEYHCNQCGTDFICYDGYVVKKKDWISMCKKKNHAYPFS